MKSGHHALQSVGVSIVLLVVTPPSSHPLVLVGVVLGLGVGIDVDHFLIARLRTDSWKNLRRVIERPSIVFLDQESIFDEGEVGPVDRLASHVLIGAVGAGLLWLFGLSYWAGVVVVTLLVHLVADVYESARKRLDDGEVAV